VSGDGPSLPQGAVKIETMNCDFCANLPVQARTNLNHLREQLCITRLEADIERERYFACCRNTEKSLAALTRHVQALRLKGPTSKSSAVELEHLTGTFISDSTAVSDQLKRMRTAETQVKYYEACINNKGIWLVHIPEQTNVNERRVQSIGYKRKDSAVDQSE
jgi:hypothetical protein